MATKTLPSREYLCERLSYDEETGFLKWKLRPARDFKGRRHELAWNTKYAGSIAGAVGPHNISIFINYSGFRAHRIIWMMIYGSDPGDVIDHINNNPHDNSLSNLRIANKSQNGANSRFRKNKSGFKGVTKLPHGRYRASLSPNGKSAHIGVYDTPEEAHAAYCSAAKKHYGDFWRPN